MAINRSFTTRSLNGRQPETKPQAQKKTSRITNSDGPSRAGQTASKSTKGIGVTRSFMGTKRMRSVLEFHLSLFHCNADV